MICKASFQFHMRMLFTLYINDQILLCVLKDVIGLHEMFIVSIKYLIKLLSLLFYEIFLGFLLNKC